MARVMRDERKMREAADAINSELARIVNAYGNIYGLCQNLRKHWEGGGAEEYIKKLENPETADQIIALLKKYAADLNAIAEDTKQTENKIASSMEELK